MTIVEKFLFLSSLPNDFLANPEIFLKKSQSQFMISLFFLRGTLRSTSIIFNLHLNNLSSIEVRIPIDISELKNSEIIQSEISYIFDEVFDLKDVDQVICDTILKAILHDELKIFETNIHYTKYILNGMLYALIKPESVFFSGLFERTNASFEDIEDLLIQLGYTKTDDLNFIKFRNRYLQFVFEKISKQNIELDAIQIESYGPEDDMQVANNIIELYKALDLGI